ncbi:Uncharacterized protein SCF082_LOCUS51164 [Durusdinium trenchii]|uniref:Heme NO-binding domain-containing protein n=1 Tax=Durusdinium trenchii TaxID=1381693 RepID=A0ABP0SD34_9DINO
MYGHIHVIIKDLVISEFSEEKWAMVLHASGYADADVLDTVPHPDAVTFSLLTSLCMITAWSPDEAVEALGHHLIVFSLRSGTGVSGEEVHVGFHDKESMVKDALGFAPGDPCWHQRFLKAQGATLPIFLQNVNRSDQPDRAELRYFSPRRGFGRFVVGVVRAIGAYLYGSSDARSPSEAGPQEASMPFAALHSAMMEALALAERLKLEELSTSKMPEEAMKKRRLGLGRTVETDLLMRSTTAKTIAAAWSDIHLCQCTRFWETSEGHEEDYQLSQDALFADGFVSHCWAPPDDWDEVMGEVSYAEVKATTLAVMAKDIALGRDRSLSAWGSITFWVDKACIPQDHEDLKALCVNLLEKFILKCEYTCVLFTWNYLERLWCIYEWACFLISQDVVGPLLLEQSYLDSVRNFSLKKAKCHKESDRKLLEQKIHREYVSEEAFEKLMQATVIAFMARSMAYPAGRNPELERRLYTPWVLWQLRG